MARRILGRLYERQPGSLQIWTRKLKIVHIVDGMHPEYQRTLKAQVAEIGALTGEEPGLEEMTGNPVQMIIETAKARGSSLIVCGRRGLRGIKALGSVSERVVHRAGCSVLLIPVDEGGSGT